MSAAPATSSRRLTKLPSLVSSAVTKLPAGTPNLVKNHPVSLTRFPATTANLVNFVTKFARPTTSLVTSRLTKLTKLAVASATGHEKTTEAIGGLSVANRNVCRTAPNESVAGSSENTIVPFSAHSSFFLKKMSDTLPSSTPASAPLAPKKRSIIYIDGFNFYYGMLAERPDLKWLNYQRLAELLRPDDEILKVRLFTSVVDQDPRRRPGESTKHDRQSRILAALRTQPKITITPGKFSDRERECLVPSSCCSVPKGPQRKYWGREEKQTDVQLALQIVLDVKEEKAAGRQLDNIVLISGDIDMIPALAVAFQQDKKVRAVIYIPVHESQLKNRRKDEFIKYCDPVKPIPEKYLRQAQFPDSVELSPGVTVQRPVEWPKPVPPVRPPSS